MLFDNLPAARQNDPTACGSALASNLAATVKINGLDAATVGTLGNHGNSVVAGSSTVIIGNSHTPAPFEAPLPLIIEGVFDEFFVLCDQDSGAPLSGVPYILRSATGKELHGITDADGKTTKFSSASAETIELVITEQTEVMIA